MREKFGAKHWDFCPRTFNLPYDWNQFVDDYNRDCGDGVWILKPNASSRGRGDTACFARCRITNLV